MRTIVDATIWPLRAPLSHPIQTSFGQMSSRPALLLSLTDDAGRQGWGESWVNFPAWSLEVNTMVLFSLVKTLHYAPIDADQVIHTLFAAIQPQIFQSSQLGPIYQALSAIHQALTDLALQDEPSSIVMPVPVYASGIGPDAIDRHVEGALKSGFTDVKIKVGFDSEKDRNNFLTACKIAGPGHVMVDANQGWSRDSALHEVPWFIEHGARWIEEPLLALDWEGYHMLERWASHLASGENWLVEYLTVKESIPNVAILQPDLGKVGGFCGARRLQDRLTGHFKTIAYHVLGTPVNHAAAVYGAQLTPSDVSLVEYDTNENPFHTAILTDWVIQNGLLYRGPRPGFGILVDEKQLSTLKVPALEPWTRPFPILNSH